jgi:hypothetical protein
MKQLEIDVIKFLIKEPPKELWGSFEFDPFEYLNLMSDDPYEPTRERIRFVVGNDEHWVVSSDSENFYFKEYGKKCSVDKENISFSNGVFYCVNGMSAAYPEY